eukprot:COSAG03_NODE_716_length_6124_cov_162.473693_5_plen_93_part_00
MVEAAKGADVVALFLGLDGSIENEGQDRPIDVVRPSPLLSLSLSVPLSVSVLLSLPASVTVCGCVHRGWVYQGSKRRSSLPLQRRWGRRRSL